jgi:hypothetical protein
MNCATSRQGINQPIPRKMVLLEKPAVNQPVQKSAAFYGTGRLITVYMSQMIPVRIPNSVFSLPF